jgi:hypothetical protein
MEDGFLKRGRGRAAEPARFPFSSFLIFIVYFSLGAFQSSAGPGDASRMKNGSVRIGYSNYLFINKEIIGINLYLYIYPQVERHTHTCQVSDGYQIPIGFVILYVKITLK